MDLLDPKVGKDESVGRDLLAALDVLLVRYKVAGQEEGWIFGHPANSGADLGPEMIGDVEEMVDAGIETSASISVGEDRGFVGPVGWFHLHLDHDIVLFVVDYLAMGMEDGKLLVVDPGIGKPEGEAPPVGDSAARRSVVAQVAKEDEHGRVADHGTYVGVSRVSDPCLMDEVVYVGVGFVELVLLDLAESTEAVAVSLVDLDAIVDDWLGHGSDLLAKDVFGGKEHTTKHLVGVFDWGVGGARRGREWELDPGTGWKVG